MDIFRIDRSTDNADRLRVSITVLAGFAAWPFLWLSTFALVISAAVAAAVCVAVRHGADRTIAANQLQLLPR